MKSKPELRREIEEKRKALKIQWLEAASTAIIRNILSLEIFQAAETVALYKAIGGEVNLEPLFARCWSLGKRTVIPVFNAAARAYDMAEIGPDTRFTAGNYGIPEPENPQLFKKSRIDLIAVPGVGFDRTGKRLGRGGGYYDRILAGFGGFTAGICFDFQLVPEIPVDAHDLPVTHLVTESIFVKV